MKPLFLLILFAASAIAINHNNQQAEKPLDAICGKEGEMKCLTGGVLNRWIASVELPPYPQKAQENQVEGTVKVQLIFNEAGEVISTSPASGPEELWSASVKTAVNTRFRPIKLSGKPIKVTGVLQVDFKNGKIEVPRLKGEAPVTMSHP